MVLLDERRSLDGALNRPVADLDDKDRFDGSVTLSR